MRATCESCQGAQPVDWKAGDLCVHCSGPVRREERCFWCNTWQPVGGFCRSCGAEQVGYEQFGAARMLTLTGADMFSIPKLVREMEPGRLAVFGDKYGRQRGLVAQHVDDLVFVERFVRHQGFAARLEDELLTSLPWTDDAAASYKHPPGPIDGVERLRHIITHSPLQQTKSLATIALLWSEEWSMLREVAQLGRYASAEDFVAQEAVLAVTWWRTVTACGLARHQVPVEQLATVTLPEQLAVRLAFFGQKDVDSAVIASARASQDPDLAFAAALAVGDTAVLANALRSDPVTQRAAASVLAERGDLVPLQGWLRGADKDAQRAVAHSLAHDKNGRGGVLTAVLLDLMEGGDEKLIVDVGRLLARDTTLSTALRVAAACRGEIYVVQALMNAATGLGPFELAQVGTELAKRKYLTHSKYGVAEAAKRGAFPDDFVPSVFDLVDDEERVELCRFAESQLEGRDIESLHAFMLRTVFGPYSAKVRSSAWWSLSRGYKRVKYGWDGPFELTPESIERFFPSVPALMESLIAVLGDLPTLKEVGLFDFLHNLIHGLDAQRIDALRTYEPCERLFAAMHDAEKLDIWSPLQDSLRRAIRRFRREEAA